MDVRMLDTFLEHDVDVIQIGTRNMQNFDLLKEVGKVRRAGDPEARHERDDRRVADGGRVHRRGRQPPHHPVRARHPHVRDRVSQRARRHGGRRC